VAVEWIERAFGRLDAEARDSLSLSISRRPFFLYPAATQSTVPSGWGERVSRLYSPETWRHIVDLGAAAGFAFNATSPLSDTLDSHRLMVLAGRQGRQREVVREVSRRYFEEGVPLNDRRMLLAVADAHGVEGAAAFLESNAGTREVLESVERMRAAGIHSIPVARISSGDFATTVHGSASVDEFHAIFREIAAAR
jgi:predicted DsbA family dithiol-disulfide isomerase